MSDKSIENELSPSPRPHSRPVLEAWPHIEEALHGLRFGVVTVIVQDGVVVQVERTEKKRVRRHAGNG